MPFTGLIARWLLARNPARTAASAARIANGLVVAGLLVLAVAGFAAWLHFHDAGVRRSTNLERDLGDLQDNVEANSTAGRSKVARDREEQSEQEGLEDEVDEAEDAGRSAADDLWTGGLFD